MSLNLHAVHKGEPQWFAWGDWYRNNKLLIVTDTMTVPFAWPPKTYEKVSAWLQLMDRVTGGTFTQRKDYREPPAWSGCADDCNMRAGSYVGKIKEWENARK